MFVILRSQVEAQHAHSIISLIRLLLAQVEEVIPQAKSAGKDLQKAAESTASDVQRAADNASKEAGQTINAAQDTVDLVSPLPQCLHTRLSLQSAAEVHTPISVQ